MAKILFVEDDLDLSQRIIACLKAEGHLIEHADKGIEGAAKLEYGSFDLIILDWRLPDLSGLDLCKQFRAAGGKTPMIMLTGKTSTPEKEEGLDGGVDDYVIKPCDVRELMARIRALLRRPPCFIGNFIQAGSITLDTLSHKVTIEGKHVALQPKEFALLEFLMKYPEQPFKPETLQQQLWSTDCESSLEAVYTCITTLRKKLRAAGSSSPIRSIYGVGYKLSFAAV
jgi:OmpR-family two-component system manganese-sensing response regulator